MSDHADLLDEQLGRIREVLGALETHVESTLLSGEADMTQNGAHLALLADGGGISGKRPNRKDLTKKSLKWSMQ